MRSRVPRARPRGPAQPHRRPEHRHRAAAFPRAIRRRPHGYHRGLRLEYARRRLSEGADLLATALECGFESASVSTTPSAANSAARLEVAMSSESILYRQIETPVGSMLDRRQPPGHRAPGVRRSRRHRAHRRPHPQATRRDPGRRRSSPDREGREAARRLLRRPAAPIRPSPDLGGTPGSAPYGASCWRFPTARPAATGRWPPSCQAGASRPWARHGETTSPSSCPAIGSSRRAGLAGIRRGALAQTLASRAGGACIPAIRSSSSRRN